MPAFGILNQGARELILSRAVDKRMGVMVMYAMRGLYADAAALRAALQKMATEGLIDSDLAASEDPLGFLIHELGASNLTEAAYRYARHEPGVQVVLFGTSDKDHLRANIAAINKPALPKADRERLEELFGGQRATQASTDLQRETRS